MAFDPGDVWVPQLTVKNSAGALTAATVVVTVTNPSGVVSTPTVVPGTTGIYTATVPLTEPGRWMVTWAVSGAVTGVETQHAYVRRLGSNLISVHDVRTWALNKTLPDDDAEIEDKIDAALAEYAEYVAPLPGDVTEVFDGGSTALVLSSPQALSVTAASYTDGTSITPTDLTVRNGIVRWGPNTAGRFAYGSQNVSVTYRVNSLPANHRETIIADVAGYFEATQRGPAGLPGEGYEAAFTATPLVLFPRIRALAPPRVA